MRLLAPAKLNLHLRVAAPRADGFHPLMSWFCTIGLYDIITITPNTIWKPQLTCSDPSLPTDEKNLLLRAAQTIDLAANIHLEKHIPAGAGLGGGSSDAGTLLRAAKDALAPGRAEKIAATLGSDVPFFVQGGSAICTGRGEIVKSIAPPKPKWAMLILPDIHMPTPAVYRKFDEMKLGSDLLEENWNQWTQLHAQQLLPKLINDLEPTAFAIEPRLATLRADIEQRLGQAVRMSGSGSSLFTLFDTDSVAQQAASNLQLKSTRVIVCQLAPALNSAFSASLR